MATNTHSISGSMDSINQSLTAGTPFFKTRSLFKQPNVDLKGTLDSFPSE